MQSGNFLRNIWIIMKREFAGYFGSPVAYVFIVIFLLLTGFFTFYISNFFEAGQADLKGFFQWHPWLFMFLVPAVAMRLWAEERRLGTIELLLTLPVTVTDVVLGKFLAAWCFIGIALALTFPLVLTTMYLGNPDRGRYFLCLSGLISHGRNVLECGQHDLGPHPQPGGQLHSGRGGLPVSHTGRFCAGDSRAFRVGADVAGGPGLLDQRSIPFCLYCQRRAGREGSALLPVGDGLHDLCQRRYPAKQGIGIKEANSP